MALKNYGLLKGKLKLGVPYYQGYKGDPHYYLVLDVNGKEEKVAINSQSQDNSEVLFFIDNFFTHPVTNIVEKLPTGFTNKNKVPGLDYWRDKKLFDVRRMTYLPFDAAGENNDLNDLISNSLGLDLSQTPINYLIKTPKYQEERRAFQPENPNINIYVFGERFDTKDGIHDVHMNQGNPKGSHDRDNGIYQDGGLLIERDNNFYGLFFAFQSQKLPTNIKGFPTPGARKILDLP